MRMYPSKYSIYSHSIALEASNRNGIKALSYGSLLVVIVWIHKYKAEVPVDGIHNIPVTVDCVIVTHTIELVRISYETQLQTGTRHKQVGHLVIYVHSNRILMCLY